MKKIIVTPAGRKKYLTILAKYLIHTHNLTMFDQVKLDQAREETGKNFPGKLEDYKIRNFDEWHLWLNTANPEDIEFCNYLASKYEWIKVIERPGNVAAGFGLSIHRFFDYCIDPDTLYLRFDDDICFIDQRSIKNIFEKLEINSRNSLVFGTIINNAVINFLLQRFNSPIIPKEIKLQMKCLDKSWESGEIAAKIHKQYLEKLSFTNYAFNDQIEFLLLDRERVSINCIGWRGSDFAKFDGKVGIDEEDWLNSELPLVLNKPNTIIFNAPIVHFAFHTQREYLETQTSFLNAYQLLATKRTGIEEL